MSRPGKYPPPRLTQVQYQNQAAGAQPEQAHNPLLLPPYSSHQQCSPRPSASPRDRAVHLPLTSPEEGVGDVIATGIFVDMTLSYLHPTHPPLPSLHATLKTELEDSIQGNLIIQQMLEGACARSDIGQQRQRDKSDMASPTKSLCLSQEADKWTNNSTEGRKPCRDTKEAADPTESGQSPGC